MYQKKKTDQKVFFKLKGKLFFHFFMHYELIPKKTLIQKYFITVQE